jgi:hypothetical protein
MAHALPPAWERLIMHFTHLRHIDSIVGDSMIHADSLVGGRLRYEVGDRGIKTNRRELPVTYAPGGHPCDYVPFYFAPRSPMLFKIAVGGVPHYQDGQDPLVYMVSTIGDVINAGLRWVFSDGNCGAMLTGYYDQLDDLDHKVDWPLQRAQMWNSTAEDPNRATRRAAEFLVHQAMPWALIRYLVVRNEQVAMTVRERLATLRDSREVFVRAEWYYNGSKYL